MTAEEIATLELALELYFANDAETLEAALALATDLGPDLAAYLEGWDEYAAKIAAVA